MRPWIPLLLAALVTATAPAAAQLPEPVPSQPKHRLEAAGLVTGPPAPGFFSGDGLPTLPAEAVLRVDSPLDGENGELGPRRAEATLTLRPATAYAAHPVHADLHTPTVLDVTVEWTKEPSLTDPAASKAWPPPYWRVHVGTEALGEALALKGTWTPATVTTSCTLDAPPSTCTHHAVGPVHLQGTWGSADVVLEGGASDRYCTYADAGSTQGYVDRTPDSC